MRIFWIALTALSVVLAPVAPVRAQISVLGLKNGLVQYLLSTLGEPGVFEITAEQVAEPREGVTSLERVAVSDANGAWLTVERLEFSWEPTRLLSGEVEISRLAIIGLEVSRKPLPAPPSEPAASAGAAAQDAPFAWPRSPITLYLRDFSMARAHIAEGVLGPSLGFEATGAARDEGDVQQLTLNLRRTDSVEGRISVEYDRRFEANTFALELDAQEAAGGLSAALLDLPSDSGSRLSLRAEGPPSDWRVTLDMAVDALFRVSGGGKVVYEGPVSADLDIRLQPGDSLSGAMRAALGREARLRTKLAEDGARAVRIEEAFIQAQAFSARVEGLYQRDSGEMDFLAEAESGPDLARLVEGMSFAAARFDGRVSGHAEALKTEGALEFDRLAAGPFDSEQLTLSTVVEIGAALRFQVDGSAKAPRIDRLDAQRLGDAAIMARGDFTDGRLTLETARLDSAALSAGASGWVDVTAGRAELAYRLEAPDLARIGGAYDVDANGALVATGALAGPLDALALRGEAALSGFTLSGEAFSRAELRHDITLGDTLTGRISADLTGARLGAAAVSTRLALAGERLTLDELTARALGGGATGAIALNTGSGLAEGALALDWPDLAALGRYLDTPLTGALSGALRLTPADGAQAVEASLTGAGLSADGLRAGALALEARLADAAAADPRLIARLTVENAALGDGAPINRAALTLDGALSDLAIGLDANSALDGRALDATLAARLVSGAAPLSPPMRLRLERAAAVLAARGETPEARIALAAPASVAIGETEIASDGLALSLPGQGRLLGALTLDRPSGRFALKAALENGDLAALGPLAGLAASRGRLDATVSLDTRRGKVGGALTLRGRDLRIEAAPEEAGAVALDVTGRWDGARLALDGSVSGDFGDPVRASLGLPLAVDGSGAPELAANGALDGRFQWRGRAETLWALVPAAGHLLEGDVEADLRLGGSPSAPRLSGSAALSAGRYENLDLGAILTDLALRAEVSEAETLSLSLSAKDSEEGTLRGEGRISDLFGAPNAQASLTARAATLMRRDDVTATLDADVTLSGPLASPRLSGQIRPSLVEIRLIDRLPPDIADLGAVRIKGQPAPPPAAPAGPGGAALDVSLDAPGRIFVRGRGLDTEWAAALSIRGTSDSPRVTGSVTGLRGGLDLLGSRFELERGSALRFLGPADPTFSVAFTRQANDIEGRVEASGSASKPELKLASKPSLPEEEVLPRLLFGRSRQSLSPAQALELGAGVATLLSGGEGVAGLARRALGLDVLSLESGDAGSALRAGRYVADGVFVGARQGLDANGGSAFVEVEVFDGVTVDVEADRRGGSSAGVEWKWDF